MRLTSTDKTELQYIRALVYGDSGVGKTTSLRTLPTDRTTIVLTERGALPLRDSTYPVLQVECWDDIKDIYTAFSATDADGDYPFKALVDKTKVLVFDSLSAIATLCMQNIVNVDRRALTKQRTKDKQETPHGVYEDLMTQEDWGLYRKRMLNLASAFCHLPMHIIMTCLAEWRVDKDSKDTLRLPNLGGKTALEIPAYFDLVFNMRSRADEQGNTSRVWQTFDDGMVRAKDASGVLDPFEEANWTKVFAKIIGDKPKPKKQETTNG